MINRDAILAELLDIESLLQDDRLNDQDRDALHCAASLAKNILEPDTWHLASQTSTASHGQATVKAMTIATWRAS